MMERRKIVHDVAISLRVEWGQSISNSLRKHRIAEKGLKLHGYAFFDEESCDCGKAGKLGSLSLVRKVGVLSHGRFTAELDTEATARARI